MPHYVGLDVSQKTTAICRDNRVNARRYGSGITGESPRR
jgi:hypothetical protein